jgi:hypothetical protein
LQPATALRVRSGSNYDIVECRQYVGFAFVSGLAKRSVECRRRAKTGLSICICARTPAQGGEGFCDLARAFYEPFRKGAECAVFYGDDPYRSRKRGQINRQDFER